MRTILSLTLLALTYGFAQYASYGSVYEGGEGVSVTLLPSEDGESALVRLERTGSPLDGLVLSADYDAETEQVTLDYRGRGWPLVSDDGYGGRVLRVPGQREEVLLYYDDEASEGLNVAELIRDAERDQADAEAATAFDRIDEEAQVLANLEPSLEGVTEACGYQPAVNIAWDAISDDALANTSIYSFASIPLDAMARVCREDAALAEQLSGSVSSVVYEFGGAMTLSVDGDTLVWRNNPDAPNQQDFAYNTLLNTLRTATP